MIKFIRALFGLCDHKWKIINTINLVYNQKDAYPCGIEYHLQCEHCGNIKTKTIK